MRATLVYNAVLREFQYVIMLDDGTVQDVTRVTIVKNIYARNQLKNAALAWVLDASSDPEVGEGSAMYGYDAETKQWKLIAGSKDIEASMTLLWTDILGRPNVTVGQIEDAVGAQHSHNNLAILNKINAVGAATGQVLTVNPDGTYSFKNLPTPDFSSIESRLLKDPTTLDGSSLGYPLIPTKQLVGGVEIVAYSFPMFANSVPANTKIVVTDATGKAYAVPYEQVQNDATRLLENPSQMPAEANGKITRFENRTAEEYVTTVSYVFRTKLVAGVWELWELTTNTKCTAVGNVTIDSDGYIVAPDATSYFTFTPPVGVVRRLTNFNLTLKDTTPAVGASLITGAMKPVDTDVDTFKLSFATTTSLRWSTATTTNSKLRYFDIAYPKTSAKSLLEFQPHSCWLDGTHAVCAYGSELPFPVDATELRIGGTAAKIKDIIFDSREVVYASGTNHLPKYDGLEQYGTFVQLKRWFSDYLYTKGYVTGNGTFDDPIRLSAELITKIGDIRSVEELKAVFAEKAHTHELATSSRSGFMSAADKERLDRMVASNGAPLPAPTWDDLGKVPVVRSTAGSGPDADHLAILGFNKIDLTADSALTKKAVVTVTATKVAGWKGGSAVAIGDNKNVAVEFANSAYALENSSTCLQFRFRVAGQMADGAQWGFFSILNTMTQNGTNDGGIIAWIKKINNQVFIDLYAQKNGESTKFTSTKLNSTLLDGEWHLLELSLSKLDSYVNLDFSAMYFDGELLTATGDSPSGKNWVITTGGKTTFNIGYVPANAKHDTWNTTNFVNWAPIYVDELVISKKLRHTAGYIPDDYPLVPSEPVVVYENFQPLTADQISKVNNLPANTTDALNKKVSTPTGGTTGDALVKNADGTHSYKTLGGITEAEKARLLPELTATSQSGLIPTTVQPMPTGINMNDMNSVFYIDAGRNTAKDLSPNPLLNVSMVNFPSIVSNNWKITNSLVSWLDFLPNDVLKLGKEFTIDMYMKIGDFTSTSRIDRPLFTDATGKYCYMSNYSVPTAGKFDFWAYNDYTPTARLTNGVFVHFAVDVYYVNSVRKYTIYLNGTPLSTTDSTTRFTDVKRLFGADDGSSSGFSDLTLRYVRISNIARYKGTTFTSPGTAGYTDLPAVNWSSAKIDEHGLLAKRLNQKDEPTHKSISQWMKDYFWSDIDISGMSPVFHYPFTKDFGDKIRGNGFCPRITSTGTVVGETKISNGMLGFATYQYLTIPFAPTDTVPMLNGNWSVGVRLVTSVVSTSSNAVISIGSDGGWTTVTVMVKDGKIYIERGSGGFDTGAYVSNGLPHSVILTHTANTLKVYVDGVCVSTQASSYSAIQMTTAYLMRGVWGTQYSWNVTIRDLFMCSKALSLNEVVSATPVRCDGWVARSVSDVVYDGKMSGLVPVESTAQSNMNNWPIGVRVDTGYDENSVMAYTFDGTKDAQGRYLDSTGKTYATPNYANYIRFGARAGSVNPDMFTMQSSSSGGVYIDNVGLITGEFTIETRQWQACLASDRWGEWDYGGYLKLSAGGVAIGIFATPGNNLVCRFGGTDVSCPNTSNIMLDGLYKWHRARVTRDRDFNVHFFVDGKHICTIPDKPSGLPPGRWKLDVHGYGVGAGPSELDRYNSIDLFTVKRVCESVTDYAVSDVALGQISKTHQYVDPTQFPIPPHTHPWGKLPAESVITPDMDGYTVRVKRTPGVGNEAIMWYKFDSTVGGVSIDQTGKTTSTAGSLGYVLKELDGAWGKVLTTPVKIMNVPEIGTGPYTLRARVFCDNRSGGRSVEPFVPLWFISTDGSEGNGTGGSQYFLFGDANDMRVQFPGSDAQKNANSSQTLINPDTGATFYYTDYRAQALMYGYHEFMWSRDAAGKHYFFIDGVLYQFVGGDCIYPNNFIKGGSYNMNSHNCYNDRSPVYIDEIMMTNTCMYTSSYTPATNGFGADKIEYILAPEKGVNKVLNLPIPTQEAGAGITAMFVEIKFSETTDLTNATLLTIPTDNTVMMVLQNVVQGDGSTLPVYVAVPTTGIVPEFFGTTLLVKMYELTGNRFNNLKTYYGAYRWKTATAGSETPWVPFTL